MNSAQTQYRAAWLFLLSIILLSGCRAAEPSHIDCYYGEVYQPFDASTDSLTPPDPFRDDASSSRNEATHAVNWQDEAPASPQEIAPPAREPFQMPRELPGAETPPLHLPPPRPDAQDEQRQQAIRRL